RRQAQGDGVHGRPAAPLGVLHRPGPTARHAAQAQRRAQSRPAVKHHGRGLHASVPARHRQAELLSTVIVTGVARADPGVVDQLAALGVATVHEAIGRAGYLGPGLRPIQDGARTGGTAVTVLCWPGDNLMIHAAVEQCRPGDLLVVTTTSPCTDGLFATALVQRGVRGLVTTTGVRDVTDLRAMGFPVWSAAVS